MIVDYLRSDLLGEIRIFKEITEIDVDDVMLLNRRSYSVSATAIPY